MSKYILIVDDNPSDLILTGFLVEQQGYIPIRAKNGFEALEKVEEFPISAFVVDLQMPQMSGLELIKRIRSQNRFEKIPILVMSARREERDVRKAIQLGSNDYIVKPVDPAIFEEKILRLLGKNEGWAEAPLDKSSLDCSGSLLESIELVALSEVGATFNMKAEPKKGDTRIVNAPLLKQNGLENIQVVVRSSEQIGDQFRVRVSFVGLPESLLKKLRVLCKDIWTQQSKGRFAA